MGPDLSQLGLRRRGGDPVASERGDACETRGRMEGTSLRCERRVVWAD